MRKREGASGLSAGGKKPPGRFAQSASPPQMSILYPLYFRKPVLGWGLDGLFRAHSRGIPREKFPEVGFRRKEMYNVCMEGIQFLWDEKKNRANRRKHGVSFEEAQTAFFDERAKVFFDPDHSEDEDRFILLGVSFRLRVLVVCHCYRENDKVIRIISARKADRSEQEDYGR